MTGGVYAVTALARAKDDEQDYTLIVLLSDPMPMPPLPPGASDSARIVATGFKELLGLRSLRDPGSATPYSWDFAAAWNGIGRKVAGSALRALRAARLIEQVDERRVGAKKILLYLPGPGIGCPRSGAA
jgi:hypothetical protein